MHEIAGAFVLLTLALALAALVALARAHHWFAERHEVYVGLPAEAPGGIRRGSEVQVLGTVIGEVERIEAMRVREQDDRAIAVPTTAGGEGNPMMIAVLELHADVAALVRTDSRATIKRKFWITGDAIIDLAAGEGAPLMRHEVVIAKLDEDLNTLISVSIKEIRDQATTTLERATTLLEEYTELARDLRDPDGEVQVLLARLRNIAADLDAGKGTAGRILKDPALYDATEATVAQIDAAVVEVREILADLRVAVARLPKMTEIAEAEMEDARGIVLQTQETLREVESLAEAIKRHWLIRGYVDPDLPPTRLPPEEIDLDGGRP
ncbi:MAG: MlaD family protein [Planctomycetota bacterium]